MFLAVLALATALPHVVQVVSAHHGVCPAASNRIYSERVAKLFLAPLNVVQWQSKAIPERILLHNARIYGLSAVFITFDKARAVRFVDMYPGVMRVRTFGVEWRENSRFARIYFGNSGFYGSVAQVKVQQLWAGECPSK